MITLTDMAVSHLQGLLQQRSQLDQGLRIFVQGGGCAGLQYGMTYEDTSREGDTVVEVKGIRLFIDPFSAGYLEGVCIDFQDTLLGTGFRVENPNAVATCACGTSFRTEGPEEVEQICD
jgi:iron-sulfur cluster assembly accessory protein